MRHHWSSITTTTDGDAGIVSDTTASTGTVCTVHLLLILFPTGTFTLQLSSLPVPYRTYMGIGTVLTVVWVVYDSCRVFPLS